MRKSPKGNKVGDVDEGSGRDSPSSTPKFGAFNSKNTGTPGKPGIAQTGRHAGNSSITSEEDLNSQKKKRKVARTLAPSSAQKKAGDGAGGKKNVTKEYVASRVWKNESTMTFGQRVKLAETPHMWADADMAATNIVDVWEHYDANKNDLLDKSEVHQLGCDLVDRFCALYKEALVKENPAFQEADLQRLMTKDVFPHMLRGDNILEAKRLMTDKLEHELDLNKDGVITKVEFMFAYKNIARQVLTVKVRKEALSCTIL
jgi:hypothetical protein